ncbi:MAG: hypothetical protein ACT4TC_06260 [Myxococcaceae bacterium]
MDHVSGTQTVRDYCAAHSQSVLFDETGGTLFDVAGVKTLPLRIADVESVASRVNAQTQGTYLVLRYSDGHEIALSDVGIAFAPNLRQTGAIDDLPPVACLRDYATLTARLEHELFGHLDRPPTRETVRVLMMCIAILDGARAVGFDVSREEKKLEHYLAEIEKRAPNPA